MQSFPSNIKFIYPWRPYQKEVLDELTSHLKDNHLNIVAAPGSGKTVLGLEVLLRINHPTLVLAPTIAIKNQWLNRFLHLFLNQRTKPDWISTNIKAPNFLTITTYQSLHSAYSEDLIKKISAAGIKTIVIDEAHHLRNAWWQSLIQLKNSIQKPQLISLTATPPYDVDPKEWQNYQNLCGPIDAEISVPQLVLEKNLCPHQDYIYFNNLSSTETKHIQTYRDQITTTLQALKENPNFITLITGHPHLTKPEKHIKSILDNPAYLSSRLIFLNEVGIKIPRHIFKILGTSRKHIPKFNLDWAEILLEHILFKDSYYQKIEIPLIDEIKTQFRKIGCINKNNIYLKDTKITKNILEQSVNKLKSIQEIVNFEHQKLGTQLRMVILTDYIRKDLFTVKTLNQIGITTIFEQIRRNHKKHKLGILSGSLVIIPKTAKAQLMASAQKLNIDTTNIKTKSLSHDPSYLHVKIKGINNKKTVSLITDLFTNGEINILIGTKSLLGEGWDAPAINTLILASFVGSFMLSNQMRGRAIRINQNQPNKTANIWHLVSIEPGNIYGGHDYYKLKRRFKAFVGISTHKLSIENGLERMGIGKPPFLIKQIKELNKRSKNLALDRENLAIKWQTILDNGEIKKIIPQLKTNKQNLPRRLVFTNTIKALVVSTLSTSLFYFRDAIRLIIKGFENQLNSQLLATIIGLSGLLLSFTLLPNLFKSIILLLKHGSVSGSIRQIGIALAKTLCQTRLIKTDFRELGIHSKKTSHGSVTCYLKGGTTFEKSIFLECLEEILNPIQNPRYIVARKSRLSMFSRIDYHSVPRLIAKHKKSALLFSRMWKKHVGNNKLIYTRTIKGRFHLLKAREQSLATKLQDETKRIENWE